MRAAQCLLVLALLLWQAAAAPAPALGHEPSSHPGLAAVSELTARVASRAPRLNTKEARLPLPGPPDIETIKKVAQILALLGEQVIPAIIGDPGAPGGAPCGPVEDAPSDAVNDN